MSDERPKRPPDDEEEAPRGGEDDDAERSGATASMTAASQSMIGRRSTLMRTGFFKPLPTMGRLQRLWTGLGLVAGRRLSMVIGDDHIYLILMAAVVGMTSGAAAALLLTWIQFANRLFLEDVSGVFRWAAVLVVPVLGGLGAGGLRVLSTRLTGSGTPIVGPAGVIAAITRDGGRMSGVQGLRTGLGTGLSIGSGGACGHEGPSVAIGATVGAVMAQFFGLRLRRHVALVGAGCAGGLAAAFNAPLAGVIFTVELVFGGAIGGNVGTMSVFIPLIVAAVTGTFTSHAIFGPHAEFQITGHVDAALGEYGFYVLLAVVAGVLGAGMARAIIFGFRSFDRLHRLPVWLHPAAGGLAVGVLAVAVSPDLLGAGRAVVDGALHGELLWQGALLLVAAKIVASAVTLGSGGYGGAFMPSLMVGACLGTLVGTLAQVALGDGAQATSAYALVGMGAVFAGLMQAPLTPIVMLFELTHDYGIILPLMLSCILAVVVSRRFNEGGLYKMILRYRGIILDHEAEGEVMKRGLVRDLMIRCEQVLTTGATLAEVRTATLRANLSSVYVVDDEGVVVGYLNGQQLAKRMLGGEIEATSTAADLMASKLTLLYGDDTLAGAMLALARSDQDILPVVDQGRRLVGVLARSDMLKHYSDKVLGRQEEVVQVSTGGRPDQEVGLGRGIVLERVVVGRRWAGRSLAELELRRKSGVVVMEWRRGDDVVTIDPAAPLREADIVAIAGTREQILAARQLW
jgi:CIC family chloride channel protein